MKRVYWLTNIDSQADHVARALRSLREKNETIPAEVISVKNGDVTDFTPPSFQDAALVVVSFMGGQTLVEEALNALNEYPDVPYLVLAHGPNPARPRGVEPETIERMTKYLAYSGLRNIENLWRYLANTFLHIGKGATAEPEQLRTDGLYYPGEEPYGTLAEFAAAHLDPDKYTVGFFFLRDDWLWGNLRFYNALIAEIECAGMNALPLFTHWGSGASQERTLETCVQEYFYDADGKVVPDIVINNHRMSLRLGRANDPKFLEKLGVPTLQAYHSKQDEATWRANPAGLTPTEISATVAMIETDGILHGPVASHREVEPGGEPQREPWAYGLELLVRKAKRWATLRHKPNAAKKVAIVLHNYPANNTNIGCAADLDSGASLFCLLQAMQKDGYDVGDLPDTAAELWEEVLAHMTNDRRYLSETMQREATKIAGSDVVKYEKTLPASVVQKMNDTWGNAPGDAFVNNDEELLLPGLRRGNIYIALQPPRGFGEDPSAIIHSPTLAPTHHYLAYYHYLRDVFGADAFVHLGTHGSQEWLPGKQMGLSDECYSQITMDDMPNIYPYLTTIIGEGIQAKRRGQAALIGYLPAPTAQGGLYGDWEALAPLLDEYRHYKIYEPKHTASVVADIAALVEKLGMTEMFGTPTAENQEEYMLKVHNFLDDMESSETHTGLHILGEVPTGDELYALVRKLVAVAHGDVPSLVDALAEALAVPYAEIAQKALATPEEIAQKRGVDRKAEELLQALAARDWQTDTWQDLVADTPKSPALDAVLALITESILPKIQGVGQELTNLVNALAGVMVPAGPGGSAASGNLEVLPTGRNFYGIDPTKMPSATAWKLGTALGDALLEQYVAEEGKYPEQVGIIVWAGPNLRSNGQCIAEILYLLGVKPVWRAETGRVERLEVLSLNELGRPRIDVTARISGLVRDSLPQAVALINQAVALVADLDEPTNINFVKKHIEADAAELAAAGTDPAAALKEARYRVFGCPPGAYGAGVGNVLDEKNWETESDLADAYLAWGGYAYDENGAAHASKEAFAQRLKTLDVTVKNEDTSDLNLMSSDDFNAYHGGMVAASRALGGKAPRSYVGDSSQRSRVQVRTLAEEFQRVVQGEALNPKYIKGMMEHGYKGALELAKRAMLSYSWDATSGVMNDALYNRITESYVLDPEVREWMQKVNPWALHEISETMLEARQRGMWNAPEEMLAELRDIYLSTEGDLEERSE